MLASTLRAARRAASLTLGAAALAALAACGAGTTSAAPGRISLLLTDAPGDMQQAVVTISEIDLMGSSGKVVLMNTPVTTDLLTLANNTAQLVQDAVVPAGSYTQLRFVITGGYVAVDDGQGGTAYYASSPDYAGLPQGVTAAGRLQMPSYAQSGLKVNLPGGSVDVNGGQKIVLVDFNVAQSFGQQAGNSGMWVMHPVVKATDFETTGSVTVQLTLADTVTLPTVHDTAVTLGDFDAVLTAGDGTTRTLPLTDAGNGTFSAQFLYVAPGDYTVDLTAPSAVTFTTDPTRPAPVSVSSSGSATVSFTLTSATSSTP